jgi:hypothetical protein
VRINDANLAMLRVAATRVAPGAARALSDHMLALHKASSEDWGAMQREAQAVRGAAQQLLPALSRHEYSREDMRALTDAVIAVGVEPNDWQVSRAEQVAMTLEAVINAMKSAGYLGEGQDGPVSSAMNAVYASFASEQTVRPDAFAAALRNVQRAIGR